MVVLLHTFKLSICSREWTSSWFLHLVDFIQKLNFAIANHVSRTPAGRARDMDTKKGGR